MTHYLAVKQAILRIFIALPLLASINIHTLSAQQMPDKTIINAYQMLFRKVCAFNEITNRSEATSEDKAYYRRLISNRLELSDEDASKLERIAADFKIELSTIDEQKQHALSTFHARFPNGIAKPSTDITPPPELVSLQESEDVLVLRYRDRFRSELKQEDFERADKHIRQTNITSSQFVHSTDHGTSKGDQ